MKLAYYPGCSGQGTSAEYERSTRAVCRALEIGLKEISDWSCCGSTPAHACDHVLSSALSARNLALAAAEGAERVGTPCPSCLANLKTAKYRMQDEAFRDKVNALLDNPCPEELPETVSILQVLVEDYGTGAIAEKVKKPLEGIKVACYYGCLMSRPADIMQFDDAENPMAMDNIMTALGAEVVPFPLKTECCGAAMGIPRRDITARLTGRILERAQAFAEKYGFSKAYGSYEEMLADPLVDLVYIATPHSHHYLHAKMCLEAGKNVLCEKAFTVNADQARKLFTLAKEKNLLITEAIWTRYMPSRKMIDDIISSGVIGEVTAVTANLNYAISEVERIRKPELAGGALLDVGVYTINFASMVLGDKLKDVQATAIFREGVDMLDTIAMVFEGDRMATLQCGAREISDRMGSIFGTKGYIQVQNINNPEKITVFDKEHKEVAAYLPPAQITGYEYEVEACARAIAQGEKECPEMPHDETVRVMEIMDGIRKSWGYEIPLYE